MVRVRGGVRVGSGEMTHGQDYNIAKGREREKRAREGNGQRLDRGPEGEDEGMHRPIADLFHICRDLSKN